MYLFVEEKIKKAVEDGAFDDLPGIGKPLDLRDDLPGISPELKMGFKVLKNAGYVPEKGEKKTSDISIHDLLTYATDGEDKGNIEKRRHFKELAYENKWDRNASFKRYAHKIYQKLFK